MALTVVLWRWLWCHGAGGVPVGGTRTARAWLTRQAKQRDALETSI